MARRSSTSSVGSNGGLSGRGQQDLGQAKESRRPKKKLKPQLVQSKTTETLLSSSRRASGSSSSTIGLGRKTPSPELRASTSHSPSRKFTQQLQRKSMQEQEQQVEESEQQPEGEDFDEEEEEAQDEMDGMEEEEMENQEEDLEEEVEPMTRVGTKRRRVGNRVHDHSMAMAMATGDAGQEEAIMTETELEQQEEEDEINSPVVFQCATCRSIIGDSYAFVGSNAELLLVTLSNCVNVKLSSETQTSREQLDLGSSYREMLCAECQTVVGRFYLTTSQPLDSIRNLYSFNTSAITSYQLGFTQLQPTDSSSASALSAEPGATTDRPEEMVRNANACAESLQRLSHDRNAVHSLRDDMIKVQNLLLIVDERLHHLEQTKSHLEDSDGEDLEVVGNSHRDESSQDHHRRRPPVAIRRSVESAEYDDEEETHGDQETDNNSSRVFNK